MLQDLDVHAEPLEKGKSSEKGSDKKLNYKGSASLESCRRSEEFLIYSQRARERGS